MTLKILGFEFHNHSDPWSEAPPWAVELGYLLSRLIKEERRRDFDMNVDFTKITAAAQRQATVTAGVLAYLQAQKTQLDALSTQLADAIAANDPVQLKAVQDQIDAISAGIDQNDDQLAAAIATAPNGSTPAPAGDVPAASSGADNAQTG